MFGHLPMLQSPFQKLERFLRTQPLTTGRFEELLELFSATFGANGAQFIRFSAKGDLLGHYVAGLSEKAIRDYETHYHAINPRIAHMIANVPVVIDSMFLDQRDFQRTEFFEWYLRETNSRDLLAFHLKNEVGAFTMLALGRDARFGQYDEEQVIAARRLHGALASNLTLTAAVEGDASFAESLLGSVEETKALIIIDRGKRVLACTARAEELIAENTVFHIKNGELKADRHESQLQRECQTAARDGQPHSVVFPGEGNDLAIEIIPLRMNALLIRDQYLLLKIEPTVKRNLKAALLTLSPAERDICRLISEGHSLRSASDLRGVSYNTGRNQLASAHGKLGTRTVTDIVRLYGSLISSGE